MLLLGQGSPSYECRLGEQPYGEGLGVLMEEKLSKSQCCILAAQKVAPTEMGAEGRERRSSPSALPLSGPSWSAVSRPGHSTDRVWVGGVGVGAEQGHKDDGRAGACLL